jgi:hypothetical protein
MNGLTFECRMYRADLTKIWKGPIPFREEPDGRIMGQVVSVRFDSTWTIGTVVLNEGEQIPDHESVRPMTPRQRAAEMLLTELQDCEHKTWFYISVVHVLSNTFFGGYVVPGCGPTDAWGRCHMLNFIEKDCETQTTRPIPDEMMPKILHTMRMRKLNREEAENLGK